MKFKKELDSKYNHLDVEKNKYEFWLDNDLFKANPLSNKPKFSIILPPPNVTGKLHIGHAWDGSLQDALIRYKKLNGYETMFVAGMDHSGISTQVKVEAKLKEQGISKYDLGRERFLQETWKWKEEYAKIIREQWAKLGLSLDYSYESFTLDPHVNDLVNKIFVSFYNKGIIYKDKKIVNWDPIQKTAISNIEVIYDEVNGHMYYFKYMIENSNDYLEIATTRPETMFADQCVVVNPNDKRYTKLIGKNVINPVNLQVIPVIADDYVDIDFGSGAMKCTPAHDLNDFEIGKRHNLERPICLNVDGTVNEMGGNLYKGLDRFEARKLIIKELTKNGTFIKQEDIVHQVGFSERSNAVVEPYLSEQWFVKMDSFSQMILDLQESNKAIKFFPERFNNVLKQWMENAYDWTISRQLWWGHQIPCWYHNETKEVYVSETPPSDIENWTQDGDVLDTWFSSGLWPFATMFKDNQEFDSPYYKAFFPISVLVTGYDIIFFWVARMIFQTMEYTNSIPFNDVLVHGLVRDEQGRKMSKSLGNGIDPMDIISETGSDALRFFLLTNSTPGQDIHYSQDKVAASWNFINKIWNASRYVIMNLNDEVTPDLNWINNNEDKLNVIDQWILTELSKVKKETSQLIDNYEFGVAGKIIYDFVWTKFCSWYIELSKASLQKSETKLATQQTLFYVLEKILIMLHPFLPFVTEEIYQVLDLQKSILLTNNQQYDFNFDTKYINEVINIVTKIREFRKDNKIKNAVKLEFKLSNLNKVKENLFNQYKEEINHLLNGMVNVEIINEINNQDLTSVNVEDYFLEIATNSFIDKEKVLQELIKRKEELANEIKRSQNILNNESFLQKASADKIKVEQDKFTTYQEQLSAIELKIKNLK